MLRRLSVPLLLVGAVILAACGPLPAAPPAAPPVSRSSSGNATGDVLWVAYLQALPGLRGRQPLFPDDAADARWIAFLLQAVHQAPPAVAADGIPKDYASLEIHLEGNRAILIRPVWVCHRVSARSGACTEDATRQVITDATVHGNDIVHATQRVVASPALTAFWTKDLAQAMPLVTRLVVTPAAVRPGATVSVRGKALRATGDFQLGLIPERSGKLTYTLGQGVLTDGCFTWAGQVPANVPPGAYAVQVSAGSDSASAAFTVFD